MTDTVRLRPDLAALLPDNIAGLISAQDVRDFLVSSMASYVPYHWVRPTCPVDTTTSPNGLTPVALSSTVIRVGLFEVHYAFQATKWGYWIATPGTSQVRLGLYQLTAQYTLSLLAQGFGVTADVDFGSLTQNVLLGPGIYAIAVADDGAGTHPSLMFYNTGTLDWYNTPIGVTWDWHPSEETKTYAGGAFPDTLLTYQMNPVPDCTLYMKFMTF